MMYNDLQSFLTLKEAPKRRPPFSLLIEHVLQSSGTAADLFWTNYLKSCQPRLRASTEASKSQKVSAGSCVSVYNAREKAKSLGITVQSLAQSAFAVHTMEVFNQTDVLFGVIQAGRSFVPDANEILGPCMNTVVMRASVDMHSTTDSLARALHTDNISMSEYIHTPLRRVQSTIGKGPLFETLFVYVNNSEEKPANDNWTVIYEDASVEFPLSIECTLTNDAIEWTVALHEGYLPSAKAILDQIDAIFLRIVESTTTLVFPEEAEIFKTTISGNADSDSSDICGKGLGLVGSVEMIIAQELSDMTKINVNEISLNATVFELGLDSISVIELSKRLKRENLRISVGEILRNPCIKDMRRILDLRGHSTVGRSLDEASTPAPADAVQRISSQDQVTYVSDQIKVDTADISTILPGTAAQTYFITTWQALKGARFMSNFVFTLSPSTTMETVESRWNHVCQDHTILRTAFSLSQDKRQILQCIFRTSQSPLQLYNSSATDSEGSINEFIRSEQFLHPNLTRPPVSLTVISDKCEQSKLILSIHHALYDASSLSSLLQWLQYGIACNPAVTYPAFSDLLVNKAPETISWWVNYLSSSTPFFLSSKSPGHKQSGIEFTNGVPRQTDLIYEGKHRDLAILSELSSKFGLTLQAILVAAIGRCLAQISGLDNVIVGMYTSGRSLDLEGVEEVFGPTVNVVPLRLDGVKSRPLMISAREVHHTLIEINSFVQQVPIHEIYEATGWSAKTGGLVDVAVNILPRRRTTSRSRADERLSSAAFTDYGPLAPRQVRGQISSTKTSLLTVLD